MKIPRPDGSRVPDPSSVIASLARDQVNVAPAPPSRCTASSHAIYGHLRNSRCLAGESISG